MDSRRFSVLAAFCVLVNESAILINLYVIYCDDKCIWYGHCGVDPQTGLSTNCVDDKPPRPLNETTTSKLRQVCPSLINSNGITKTCCDASQIDALIANFEAPTTFLGRCPACLENFKDYFCTLTCSPLQSQFLHVQSSVPVDKTDPNVRAVTEVEYLVTKSYADRMMSSCREVIFAATGGKAIDMMCGSWGYKYCTGQRWLTYLGEYSNNFTPFLINVTYWDSESVEERQTTYHPMNRVTVPCNEDVGSERACSCEDCFASCIHPPHMSEVMNFCNWINHIYGLKE